MAILARWEFSADGNGAWVSITPVRGMELSAQGTWGGGTLKLQYSDDGGTTAIDVEDMDDVVCTRTSNGTIKGIVAAQGTMMRAVLSGSTSPTLIATLREVVGG